MARSFVGLHGSPQWGVNEPKHAWAKDVRICRNEHLAVRISMQRPAYSLTVGSNPQKSRLGAAVSTANEHLWGPGAPGRTPYVSRLRADASGTARPGLVHPARTAAWRGGLLRSALSQVVRLPADTVQVFCVQCSPDFGWVVSRRF